MPGHGLPFLVVRPKGASELHCDRVSPGRYAHNMQIVLFFILNKKLARITILVALHTKHNIFEVISHFTKPPFSTALEIHSNCIRL